MESTPRNWILSKDTCGSSTRAAALFGFCVPRRFLENGIEFCCNQILTLVFLTKKEGLFKLLLISKWQDLILMAWKTFHTISNFLPTWPRVFLFQEAIVEFQASCLLLIVTNQSHTGKDADSPVQSHILNQHLCFSLSPSYPHVQVTCPRTSLVPKQKSKRVLT